MKREIIYKLLYAVSALFTLGFVISFGVDIYKYNTPFTGSAPLYAYALVRLIEFIFPAIIAFTVGAIIHCKSKG